MDMDIDSLLKSAMNEQNPEMPPDELLCVVKSARVRIAKRPRPVTKNMIAIAAILPLFMLMFVAVPRLLNLGFTDTGEAPAYYNGSEANGDKVYQNNEPNNSEDIILGYTINPRTGRCFTEFISVETIRGNITPLCDDNGRDPDICEHCLAAVVFFDFDEFLQFWGADMPLPDYAVTGLVLQYAAVSAHHRGPFDFDGRRFEMPSFSSARFTFIAENDSLILSAGLNSELFYMDTLSFGVWEYEHWIEWRTHGIESGRPASEFFDSMVNKTIDGFIFDFAPQIRMDISRLPVDFLCGDCAVAEEYWAEKTVSEKITHIYRCEICVAALTWYTDKLLTAAEDISWMVLNSMW